MSHVRPALEQALGPLYRVEREVRSIGPVRLFVVTTIPTGPELLVKVLPAAESLAIDAERFERDVLVLASKLKHPNLVAPRSAGRASTWIYHARPFIEGTTLHAWVAKHGMVQLGRAVEILHGILAGLAHAHAQKCAHGELRSENILLGTNGVMVADVGIKRALGGAAAVRNDMVALTEIIRDMLIGTSPHAYEVPLERSRSLPPWLNEWLATQWTDAGKALEALRPLPPFSAPGSRPSRPVL
jgi:serine/threonine-protein kinase